MNYYLHVVYIGVLVFVVLVLMQIDLLPILGIYGSDQSTKSLNYAQGYWSKGAKDNNCFMFVMDMAMGKEYIPSGPSQNLPKPGYDSTYAVGGKSGVMNNEMIVYNINQVNLKYLIEFSEN